MSTFKANRGNLLQHWVTCEAVEALNRAFPDGHLGYHDAHAMAPASFPDDSNEPTRGDFDTVVGRVAKGEASSTYERAWRALSPKAFPYPSSARFVRAVWTGRVSFRLCETDEPRQQLIKQWAAAEGHDVEVLGATWQKSLALRNDCEVSYVQFDPFAVMTTEKRAGQKHGVMYPSDFRQVSEIVASAKRPTVVQISSYRANVASADQEQWVLRTMSEMGLASHGSTRADRSTFSSIFSTRLEWPQFMDNAQAGFQRWMSKFGSNG